MWVLYLQKFANQVALQPISLKLLKIKSDNTFTLKKPFFTPNFCKRNLSRMHHFRTVNFSTFKIALVHDQYRVRDCLKRSNFESKRIHNFKTVNLRQMSLAEVRGNERFFKVKVLFDFHFGEINCSATWLAKCYKYKIHLGIISMYH